MTGRTESRSQVSESYYDKYPSCEYCGHVVFPGEQQELDHGSLVWHSAHCFRCYWCHREFHEGRPYHLLPHLALCDDCYPRREFLVDEWESLNKGENLGNKQPRVCFLCPVTKSEPEDHALLDFRSSEAEKHAQDKNAFYQVPRQLAFGMGEPPDRDRDRYPKAKMAHGPGIVTRVSSEVIGNNRRGGTNKEEAARGNTDETVAALIADAMEGAGSHAEAVPSSTRVARSAERATTREEVVIDDKFTVVAVDEWAEVVSRGPSETEYIKTDGNVDGIRTCSGLVASSSSYSGGKESADVDVNWRLSSRALRRTSSCSDLYKSPISGDPLNSSSDGSNESYHSDSLILFRSFPSSEEKDDIDPAREANPCGSPSPLPHSSTPIPHNGQDFVTNDRPPSSLREGNANATNEPPRTQTISSHDESLDHVDTDGEVPSFQEIRAIFQHAPEGQIKKFCCACLMQAFPADCFDCLQRAYHLRCFRCFRCKARLNPQSYRDDGLQPYCKTCFLDLKVSKNRIPSWRRRSPSRDRLNSL